VEKVGIFIPQSAFLDDPFHAVVETAQPSPTDGVNGGKAPKKGPKNCEEGTQTGMAGTKTS
jgi:hypothetical protein